MNTNLLQSLSDRQREAVEPSLRALTAKTAALTIAQMDPHMLGDLICYLNEFAKAQKENDPEDQQYIIEAIEELFMPPHESAIRNASTLDEFEAEILSIPAGRRVKQELDARNAAFLDNYRALKERSGLNTQAKVARRANLSLTTIQSIESGRVRPQFRTLQKLADAFGVSVNELWPG